MGLRYRIADVAALVEAFASADTKQQEAIRAKQAQQAMTTAAEITLVRGSEPGFLVGCNAHFQRLPDSNLAYIQGWSINPTSILHQLCGLSICD
jgi:hypothetical protein